VLASVYKGQPVGILLKNSTWGRQVAEERITIELEGRDEEEGEIRLRDFIAELEALSTSLRRTQQEITEDSRPVVYRVAGLSFASPYRVTVAIASRTIGHSATPRRIAQRWISSLRMVRSNHRFARRIDPEVLDSFKALTPPPTNTIKSVTVTMERRPPIPIDQSFTRNLERLTATNQSERDEIVGRLEQLNVHNRTQFHIYPAVGPKKILCKAPISKRADVVSNAGRRVLVQGVAHYRQDARFPHEMSVENIFPFPADDALPKLSDLHGIAPGSPDDPSPEDFVREFRDANW
jgi:hypothetical protein